MQIPLQITFRGMLSSPALEDRIHINARKLERFHGGITRCHVFVEASNREHRPGSQFDVHINLTVPGAEIVASRQTSDEGGAENVYVALRDAFAAVTRQLEDQVRKSRGDVRRYERRLEPRV
jgi:ribosome-associated translation inhibitor RaiA